TGEYKENLATAWQWVDDKTLELELRQGVKFHDGGEFDADDVVSTLNFVSRPESNITNYRMVRWIDHVEKRGPYKVRIVARQPFPAAIAFLASPNSVIHPRGHYAARRSRSANEIPSGTGPFRIVEYATGKYIRLVRNPDYFKQSPKGQPKIE